MAKILKVTKANGTSVELPDPHSMTLAVYDIDADTTGRDQSGKMFRDRVAVKQKVNCTWSAIDVATAKTILAACSDAKFTLSYLDPVSGNRRSMTCYVGDRELPVYTVKTVPSATGSAWTAIYEQLSMNFIEY